MPTVTIPPGSGSEPNVFIAINGVEQSQVVGVPFAADDQLLEVLEHSYLADDIESVAGLSTPAPFDLDFVTETYLVEGVVTDLGDILIEDAAFGGWDPNQITNGIGLVGGADSAPVFTNDILALVTGGSTFIAEFTGSGDGHALRFELVDSDEYNTYYSYKGSFGSIGTGLLDDNTTQLVLPLLAASSHKAAITMVDGRIAVSVDGGEVDSIDPATLWNPVVAVMNMIVSAGVTLTRLTAWPALDDIDLPAMSA